MPSASRSRRRRIVSRYARRASTVVLLCLLSGCTSSKLQLARAHYYRGEYEKGAAVLDPIAGNVRERALMLMERGMIQQARGAYKESTQDWLYAHELTEHLDYLSISRGSSSLLINDNVMAFRGALYERVLLHAFAAKSYMAMELWDGAGVEARNIISKLETRDTFPDDPYSRYVAGFFLEMSGDGEGAAVQYRIASELLKTVVIDPGNGRLGRAGPREGESDLRPGRTDEGPQLVCFIAIGSAAASYRPRTGRASPGNGGYASIYDGERCLGRSYRLAGVPALRRATEKAQERTTRAKRAARIAIKEAAAQLAAEEDQALGDIVRLLLFSLETDDVRHWETLPHDLHVARVACPRKPRDLRVTFHNARGRKIAERRVTSPIARRGDVYGTFLRAY